MNGWVEKRLGEVCTLQRGFDFPTRQRKKGDYPLISSSGCIDSQAEAKVSSPGVVTGRSGSIGSVFFIDKDFWPLNTTLYVKDFHGNDPRFIFHLLRKFDLKRFAGGSGVPTLNRNSVHSELVYVPSNVSEQKRIVAILDEAFEGIDRAIANTEKNLANARKLFESYLNAIFTQKGDRWITTTVGKLVDQRILDKPLDGNHGEIHPKKSDFVKSGVPFIMASDLVDGMVDQVNCNFITLEQANSLRKGFAKDGDVLLSHKGTIGRAAVLKTSHHSVVLTPQVTYYRVMDKSVIYNRYLYYFFHSPYFQNEIKTIAGAGSTRAYIGITSQLQLKIFYPKIDNQKRYADSFDTLISETQRLETIYRKKIAALNELKQSILQKAFTGELTAETANQTTKAAQRVSAA